MRIVGYFVRELDGVGLRYDFATGASAIIAGALMLWRAGEVGPVMAVVIGLLILVDCVFKLRVAMDSRSMGANTWWVTLLFTCVSLVLGLPLIFDAFKGERILSIMMGVALVADGLQNLCTVIYSSLFVKETRKAVQDVVDETPAVETTGEVVTEAPPVPDFGEAAAAAAETAPEPPPELSPAGDNQIDERT